MPSDLESGEWQSLLERLPVTIDLDKTALESGALRRKRSIKSAEELLRLILAYCVCGMSLRLAATWAHCHQLADISDVAVLKRIRKALPWLKLLVAELLLARSGYHNGLQGAPYRFRLVDATCVKTPGVTGSTWRIHSCFRLVGGMFEDFEVTAAHQAETLKHFEWQEGDVAIADRAYTTATGIHYLCSQKADFILRVGLSSCLLRHADDTTFNLLEAARKVSDDGPLSLIVYVSSRYKKAEHRVEARLIIAKQSEKATKRAAKRVKRKGQKGQYKPTAASLEMAQYLILLTSLAEERFSAEQVLQLYRLRWQIELAFKRLKSLCYLDDLRAKDAVLVQCCLYAGLLIVLLTEDAAKEIEASLREAASSKRNVSIWRIYDLVTRQLRTAIVGTLNALHFYQEIALCWRTICEPPRKRPLQRCSVAGLGGTS